jgi:hypothetical protein
VNYNGSGTLTLQPGTYVGGIVNSGPGQIVLSAGLYYLKGGGLAETGAGSVTGTGVVIYNAPQSSSDGIKLSGGNGSSIALFAPTSGTYAGIAIFQDRSSSVALTITNKGTFNVTGTVYEAHAAMIVSGSTNVVFHGDPTHGISGRFIGYDLTDTGTGTITINGGQPLLAAAGAAIPAASPPALTAAQLAPVVDEAIAMWQRAGVHGAPLRQLKRLRFQIVSLPGAELGEEDGHLIEISPDAAGYGWSLGRVPEPGRMDLSTVVAHEMGHVLGLADADTSDLMGSTLPPGVRRMPTRSELTPRLRVRAGTRAAAAVSPRTSPWARAERVPLSWQFGRGKRRGHERP